VRAALGHRLAVRRSVMPGLDPGIHGFPLFAHDRPLRAVDLSPAMRSRKKKPVDGRIKSGHDVER